MCSLIFSTKPINDLNQVNKFLINRGPDKTKCLVCNGNHYYVHNLLSITGNFTTQPLFDDEISVLFNGEIYNFKEFGDYDNDSKCIAPLYREFGKTFIDKLDGEFALVVVDYKNKTILFTTDTFGTKPLFYAVNGPDIGIATYKNALEKIGFTSINKMEANTTYVYSLDGMLLSKTLVHDFNLNQHKKTYDDWILAFDESIKKRAFTNVREKLFIGLSSGYDSGAIASSLVKQKIPFKYYTVIGAENKNILTKRWDLLKNVCEGEITNISPYNKYIAHNHLLHNTEDWKYTIYSLKNNYNEFDLSLWDDNGSNHLSHLCSLAKRDGKKILLSGAGADELHDYGWNGESKYKHSNFGGIFPPNLKDIFPWPSFYKSSMESYIMKDEVVGGSYGIEVRYPFLDIKLVQEYLWLDHTLKNDKYKSEIHEYLVRNNFPFSPNEKIGF